MRNLAGKTVNSMLEADYALMDPERSLTALMTGGTSGFGALAAGRLQQAGARVIMGSRSGASAGETVQLDLADLTAVRSFASAVLERLDGEPIGVLILNAGLILPDADRRTVDGYETTFAVNHLAHYLLLRLLLPHLSERAVVVLTTSGTHDPATKADLELPRHADPYLLANPERDSDRSSRPRKAGEHAYTASKLCTVLTARYLLWHPIVVDRQINVIAFDPGQVFGTGLAKNLSPPLRLAWSLFGLPVLNWPLRRFNPTLNSRAAAGNALADLALGLSTPPYGRFYAALRRDRLTWPDPSEMARRDDLAKALWNGSAELCGIK